MPLPQITNPNPVLIPAGQEKSFPDAFIVDLHLITLDPSGAKQRLRVMFRPYNQTTGELIQTRAHDFSLDVNDLWSEAARAPLLAQVIGAIVNIANLLVQERDLLEKIAQAGESERPALEQQLASVRTAMGVQ
jgi:hypothetical protein